VLLNFSEQRRRVSLETSDRARVLLSTARNRSGEGIASELTLDPNEAVILTVET